MEITFGPAKDLSDQRKHGVSLADAEAFEWDDALVRGDMRREYGERRMIALGYIDVRLHCVAYVDRDDERRVTSACARQI